MKKTLLSLFCLVLLFVFGINAKAEDHDVRDRDSPSDEVNLVARENPLTVTVIQTFIETNANIIKRIVNLNPFFSMFGLNKIINSVIDRIKSVIITVISTGAVQGANFVLKAAEIGGKALTRASVFLQNFRTDNFSKVVSGQRSWLLTIIGKFLDIFKGMRGVALKALSTAVVPQIATRPPTTTTTTTEPSSFFAKLIG